MKLFAGSSNLPLATKVAVKLGIKLADYQGYDQSDGALAMGISRPSFGRILRYGRKIIADALINGKIIKIRTGNVQVGVRQRNFLPYDRSENASYSMRSQLREETMRRNILRYAHLNKPKKQKTK